MVGSRNRSSVSSDLGSARVPKPPLEEWTTREKLYLSSLALKHGNAWNSVARNMQSHVEKGRPEGWSNQKTCAAQYDKLMNELGVDKRPRRNEPSDGNSNSVIYKKMAEKRIKELEENIIKLRKSWLDAKQDLDAYDNDSLPTDKSDQLKQKMKLNSTNTNTSSKLNTSISSETEKPPTRALTRRESSRQNLEKTLSILCKDASEIKSINLICKPASESERARYDEVILKHMDITIIKKRLGGEVDDPYAVMNDLLLMFQNVTMFYSPDHSTYKAAVELREKLVPQWEKALLDRFKSKH